MKWFSVNEMRTKKKKFRKFYQEIIDKILQEIPKIHKFVKSKKNKSRKIRFSKKNKTIRK